MATGKPSITTPRILELRGLQQALDAIRERLRQSDAELNLLRSFADANQSAQAIASLQAQITQLTNVVNALVVQVDEITSVEQDGSVYALVGRVAQVEREVAEFTQQPIWRT